MKGAKSDGAFALRESNDEGWAPLEHKRMTLQKIIMQVNSFNKSALL